MGRCGHNQNLVGMRRHRESIERCMQYADLIPCCRLHDLHHLALAVNGLDHHDGGGVVLISNTLACRYMNVPQPAMGYRVAGCQISSLLQPMQPSCQRSMDWTGHRSRIRLQAAGSRMNAKTSLGTMRVFSMQVSRVSKEAMRRPAPFSPDCAIFQMVQYHFTISSYGNIGDIRCKPLELGLLLAGLDIPHPGGR